MKVLIVSDTHRRHGNLETVLENVGKMDLLIHLGDAEGEEDYIEAIAGCPVEIIAGNNDFFSNLDKEKVILLGKYKVLLTHGHYYNVSLGIESLYQEAIDRDCDIAMYGHTHRPFLEQRGEVTILNPGSLSYPRQEGRKPSYMMMYMEEDGNVRYERHFLS